MNDLVRQLVGMAPGLGQAAMGNGPQFSAFMEGFERARQRDEQRKLLQQQQATAEEDRALRLEDRQRNIQRQDAADQATAQTRSQQQALQALQIPGHLAEMGGAAETPEQAKAIIESALPNLMRVFGQETMAMGMPAVDMATRTITGRQKKQVSDFVDAAMKTAFVADNPDSDPEMTNLPEHIAKILGKPSAKLSELQSFAQLPVGKPARKPSEDVSLQAKEVMVNGKPVMANFNPKTGSYTDQAGNPIQASPIPPREPQSGGGAFPPAVQRRIDAVVRGFDSQPIVKKAQTMAEAVAFSEGLDPNTTNPADDQALIYAFAKAMDPESVVREGEYATVQKYAQSWADQFGFDMKRIFSNTQFLTPQARQQLKATIRAKFDATRGQYDNLRNEYGRRIERITSKPGGADELTDFGAAFPKAPNAPTNKPTRTANPFRPPQ